MTKTKGEAEFIRAARNYALIRFLQAIRPKERKGIITWLGENVDMSFDKTASTGGKYVPYPYQIEPLEATENADVHRISLMMGQRLGKSTIWRMALMKRVADGRCSAIVAYPSLELGLKQNADNLRPLLTRIPDVKRDFLARGNVKVDSYHSPSTDSVIYFMGAGSPLLSVTAGFLVADEVDFIELQNDAEDQKNTSQLKNLWLRGQTFQDRLMIVVSSPTQYGGAIYRDWHDGSRGIWNLRCPHCGEYIPGNRLSFLTDRDGGKWAGLQWQKDANGQVIADSLRYICPHCLIEMTEDEAPELANGKYIHSVENASHRSYQAGALANPRLWSWLEIAKWQEDTSTDGRKFVHNSVLGMPFKYVKEGDPNVTIEESNRRRQVTYPEDLSERLSVVLSGIDQQKSELAGEKYYVCVIRGWDEHGNSWLLHAGLEYSVDSLTSLLTADYFGHRVTLAMIDQGGFNNSEDLDHVVSTLPNACYYKGAGAKELGNKPFIPSINQRKLFLANAIGYQVKLLDLLYSPKRPSGYGWYLPLDVSPEYFQQLCNVQPNTRMGKDSNGYEYANWAAFNSSRRDFFDAEKMALCCLDVACKYVPHTAFRRGHVPAFIAREKLLEIARKNKLDKK